MGMLFSSVEQFKDRHLTVLVQLLPCHWEILFFSLYSMLAFCLHNFANHNSWAHKAHCQSKSTLIPSLHPEASNPSLCSSSFILGMCLDSICVCMQMSEVSFAPRNTDHLAFWRQHLPLAWSYWWVRMTKSSQGSAHFCFSSTGVAGV